MILTIACIERRRKARCTKAVGRIDGHYDSDKLPLGRVYRWCTEPIVAERGCGGRIILTCSMTTCAGCRTNYLAVVQERLPAELAAQADEVLRPWCLARDREGDALPCCNRLG